MVAGSLGFLSWEVEDAGAWERFGFSETSMTPEASGRRLSQVGMDQDVGEMAILKPCMSSSCANAELNSRGLYSLQE